MTVNEMITVLEGIKDKDRVVIFTDIDGGWTNIKIIEPSDVYVCSQILITPAHNMEK